MLLKNGEKQKTLINFSKYKDDKHFLQEADLLASVMKMTDERYEVVDFSTPVAVVEHAISWLRPEMDADLLGFVKPFSLTVRF